jgi:hypothetical protein
MNKIFQVVALDPQYKLCAYEDREPIACCETFVEAEMIAYSWFKATNLETGVFNTNSQGFQSIHKPKRNKLGQFQ